MRKKYIEPKIRYIPTDDEARQLERDLKSWQTEPLDHPLEYYGTPTLGTEYISSDPSRVVYNDCLGLQDAGEVQYCLKENIIGRHDFYEKVVWTTSVGDKYPDYLALKEHLRNLKKRREYARSKELENLDVLSGEQAENMGMPF